VTNLLAGKPYHNKDSDYRNIHWVLAEAVLAGKKVVIRVIENVFEKTSRTALSLSVRDSAYISTDSRSLQHRGCNESERCREAGRGPTI
jgi:hypothetical protein